MANIAEQRIRREFKEVVKSEEVECKNPVTMNEENSSPFHNNLFPGPLESSWPESTAVLQN